MKKTFGEVADLHQTIRAQIKELIGRDDFPMETIVQGGRVVKIEYETEWKTGTTVPVPRQETYYLQRANGEFALDRNKQKIPKERTVYDYTEEYTHHKLTTEQINKLDAFIERTLNDKS